MLTRTQQFFIGVDGGGTKTHAIVVDRDADIIGEGRASAANPIIVGLDSATDAINQAVMQALHNANVNPANISSAFFGIAGIEHPDMRKQLRDSLQSRLLQFPFQLGTDALVALAGATNLEPGVVIISGTGSIAFGINELGEEARAGGWGCTIGDEGSGYYIARRGLTAVAKAYDGRGRATLISDILRQHANVRTAADLQRLIYFPFATNSDIAAYCGIVVEAARRGDATALETLNAAGRELGSAVVAVLRRLALESSSCLIAYVGGTFNAGELLLAPMRTVIKATAPLVRLQKPISCPAFGAARLASRPEKLRKSA